MVALNSATQSRPRSAHGPRQHPRITAGANRAYLFSGELTPATVPADGETLLGAVTVG